jgi:hypothetical protein
VARSERALGQAPRIIQRSNAGRIHRCGFSNPFKKKQKPSKKELRRQRGEQLYRSGRIGTLDERFERF